MATTTTVPGKFDVGLDGRGFMIDSQYLEGYRSQTLEPIRRQGDSSSSVGEASLNPEGYWRRSPESWHKGAGQARYDANDSDPERFFTSSGVDVWTEGQLSMLHSTSQIFDAAVDVLGATVGANSTDYYFHTDTGLLYKADFNTDSVAAYGPGSLTNVTSITYEGGVLFVVDDGHLYSVTASTATAWITDDPTDVVRVASASGRVLMGTSDGNTYDVSATGLTTTPAVLSSDAIVDTAAAVQGNIYYSTLSSADIYRTTVKSDGSGLEVPVIAGQLPAGEVAGFLYGYLGFLFVSVTGSIDGYRLAVPGSSGDLTFGSSFLEGDGFYTSGGQLPGASGQYVFLTGGRPGNKSTLYRCDLSVINDALVPAYATDVSESGSTNTFPVAVRATGAHPDITISFLQADGVGLKTDASGFVTGGTITMGDVSFGTREPKLFLDPIETLADGTVSHEFTLPDGTTVTDGNTATAVPSVSWKMSLTPSVATEDMTLQYPILRALPVPAYIEIETVPVLLHDHVVDRNGQDTAVDTDGQLDYLRGLRDGGTLIDYQDGRRTRSAQVIGVDRIPAQRDSGGYQWQGTAVVRMKVLQ